MMACYFLDGGHDSATQANFKHAWFSPITLETSFFANYDSEVAVFAASPGATIGCRNGIMARRPGPSCSMAFCCSALRLARKFGQPLSFSSIHFLAKLQSLISARSCFIALRVSSVTMRGPAL